MHSLRKLLKDVVYNWRYFGKTIVFNQVSMNLDDIGVIVKALGKFQDQCVGLDLLHVHYRDQQNGTNDRLMWRSLENSWWSEREVSRGFIQKLLHKEVLLLPVRHDSVNDIKPLYEPGDAKWPVN